MYFIKPFSVFSLSLSLLTQHNLAEPTHIFRTVYLRVL